MLDLSDKELLRRYADEGSEDAFAALVARHINLAYSAALRKTANPHAAEEVAQAVFIILARKSHLLRKETVLAGWLYQTARFTAANLLRRDIRRFQREQEVFMQSLSNGTESEAWSQMAPLLEDALGQLGERDRNAILLRFFEGRSFHEVAARMGASENAAKKRVGRGLEKLRKYLSRRGVAVPTAILVAAISTHSVEAAPAVLAKTVTTAALAKGAAAAGSTLTLIKSTLKLMAWTKAKTAIVTTAVVLLAAGATTTAIVRYREHLPRTVNDYYPRESWAAVGYATPEAAFESTMWALSQGDMDAFRASLTPDGLFARGMTNQTLEAFVAQSHRDTDGMTGYRILRREMLSRDDVLLTAQPEGKDASGNAVGPRDTAVFLIQRMDGAWKMSGSANNPKAEQQLRRGGR